MTSSSRKGDPQMPLNAESPSERVLVDAVKSAILDRILEDLRNDRPVTASRSRYTKSDSGVYGKYEKQDGLNEEVLATIRASLEGIIARYETQSGDDQDPREGRRAP